MTIERSFSPDLQLDGICQFLLNSQSDGDAYTYDNDVQGFWEAEGYEYSRRLRVHDHAIDPLNEPIFLARRTFVTKSCRIYTRLNRLLEILSITDPVDHHCELIIFALLFRRPGLGDDQMALIEAAFDINNLNAVDAVEADLIRAGVDPDTYQVAFSFDLVRRAAPEMRGINEAAFVAQMQNYLGADGLPLYRLVWDDNIVRSCDARSNENGAAHIFEASPDNPQPAVLADAKGRLDRTEGHQDRPCENLVLVDHRVGTAYQYYEWKTQWEVRHVRIGRCRIMTTKIPIIYSRITQQALWCFVFTEPSIVAAAEPAIKDCMIVASFTTAALVVLSGGMGIEAAATAFEAACQACLEVKLNKNETCLFSDMKLVLEHTDWEEKVY